MSGIIQTNLHAWLRVRLKVRRSGKKIQSHSVSICETSLNVLWSGSSDFLHSRERYSRFLIQGLCTVLHGNLPSIALSFYHSIVHSRLMFWCFDASMHGETRDASNRNLMTFAFMPENRTLEGRCDAWRWPEAESEISIINYQFLIVRARGNFLRMVKFCHMDSRFWLRSCGLETVLLIIADIPWKTRLRGSNFRRALDWFPFPFPFSGWKGRRYRGLVWVHDKVPAITWTDRYESVFFQGRIKKCVSFADINFEWHRRPSEGFLSGWRGARTWWRCADEGGVRFAGWCFRFLVLASAVETKKLERWS
jgi:hypothetical protein